MSRFGRDFIGNFDCILKVDFSCTTENWPNGLTAAIRFGLNQGPLWQYSAVLNLWVLTLVFHSQHLLWYSVHLPKITTTLSEAATEQLDRGAHETHIQF